MDRQEYDSTGSDSCTETDTEAEESCWAQYKTLSDDEEKEVDDLLDDTFDEKSIHGDGKNLVLIKDIKKLGEKEWLNDIIINYYFQLLGSRHPINGLQCYFLPTYFYALLMQEWQKIYKYSYNNTSNISRPTQTLLAFDKIFVPINVANNHWVLACIDIEYNSFQMYDSLKSISSVTQHTRILKNLKRFLCDEFKQIQKDNPVTANGLKEKIRNLRKWVYQTVDIPQQQNSYDCGVYVCKYAEFVSRGDKYKIQDSEIRDIRKRMILEIKHKKLFTCP